MRPRPVRCLRPARPLHRPPCLGIPVLSHRPPQASRAARGCLPEGPFRLPATQGPAVLASPMAGLFVSFPRPLIAGAVLLLWPTTYLYLGLSVPRSDAGSAGSRPRRRVPRPLHCKASPCIAGAAAPPDTLDAWAPPGRVFAARLFALRYSRDGWSAQLTGQAAFADRWNGKTGDVALDGAGGRRCRYPPTRPPARSAISIAPADRKAPPAPAKAPSASCARTKRRFTATCPIPSDSRRAPRRPGRPSHQRPKNTPCKNTTRRG